MREPPTKSKVQLSKRFNHRGGNGSNRASMMRKRMWTVSPRPVKTTPYSKVSSSCSTATSPFHSCGLRSTLKGDLSKSVFNIFVRCSDFRLSNRLSQEIVIRFREIEVSGAVTERVDHVRWPDDATTDLSIVLTVVWVRVSTSQLS